MTYGDGTLADGTTKYFCVDWINVGDSDEETDKLNSFHIILTQTPDQAPAGNFTITFNYDAVQWEAGDASEGHDGLGGTSAEVGFSAGDGIDSHADVLGGSFTPGALLDTNPATGLIFGSQDSGGQPGRYVFSVVNGPVSGGTVSGTVRASYGGTEDGAAVQICPQGGGACLLRSTNASGVYRAAGVTPGGYTVQAFPGENDESTPSATSAINVAAGLTTTAALTLGPAAGVPPDGTTVGPVGAAQTNDDGIPVINWQQPGTITTAACPGATLQYTISVAGTAVASGALVDTGGYPGGYPGGALDDEYTATYPALYPNHGAAQVAITGTCPGGAPAGETFSLYIDPSGTVVNTAGAPIAGATVTLFRAQRARGALHPGR